DRDDGSARVRELHPERAAHPPTDRPAADADVAARTIEADGAVERARRGDRLVDDDAVRRQALAQLVGQPRRVDRRLVPVRLKLALERLRLSILLRRGLLPPPRRRRAIGRRLERL